MKSSKLFQEPSTTDTMSVGISAFSPPGREMTTTAVSEKLLALAIISEVYRFTLGSGRVQSWAHMPTEQRSAL